MSPSFWVNLTPMAIYSPLIDFKHDTCFAKSLQSCMTLCDPMDCSQPGSSAHGILQARISEWVAISSSGEPSQPRDQTCICKHVLYRISYINITAFQSSELEPVKQQLIGIYHFCYFSLVKFTDTDSASHIKIITRNKQQITGWEIGNTLFWFGRIHSTPS